MWYLGEDGGNRSLKVLFFNCGGFVTLTTILNEWRKWREKMQLFSREKVLLRLIFIFDLIDGFITQVIRG